jgi:hypothetical protein
MSQGPTPAAIPDKTHPRWREIATGAFKPPQVENLGLKLLLTTLQLRVARDSTPETVQRSIDELHAFFEKHTWAVADDLRRLFE